RLECPLSNRRWHQPVQRRGPRLLVLLPLLVGQVEPRYFLHPRQLSAVLIQRPQRLQPRRARRYLARRTHWQQSAETRRGVGHVLAEHADSRRELLPQDWQILLDVREHRLPVALRGRDLARGRVERSGDVAEQ